MTFARSLLAINVFILYGAILLLQIFDLNDNQRKKKCHDVKPHAT